MEGTEVGEYDKQRTATEYKRERRVSMCHTKSRQNQIIELAFRPTTLLHTSTTSVKAALKRVRSHFDGFDDKSRDWRTLFFLFLSFSFFDSICKACPREPPNRNTSLCAVENSPQVCCQTRTCSEKAWIYIDRYSLAISPFCFCFIFIFYFSHPRFEEIVARTINQ